MTYSYDRRVITANQFDRKVKEAQGRAKSEWGSGWNLLSEEQRSAAVCRAFVALISGMDFEGTFAHNLDEPGMAEKLLKRLVDLTEAAQRAL